MSCLLGQYPVHLYLADCSMSCEGLGGGGVRAVQVQASQQASFTVGLGGWLAHAGCCTVLPRASPKQFTSSTIVGLPSVRTYIHA